jgi:phospholipid/cholesterol/gamma-HCH transport system ATP-binding protein
MSEPIIEIRNVSKAFGSNVVLRGVELTIGAGETTVIMGLSGTGKSVLLKHILGLLEPDEGSILICGVDGLRASRKQRREIQRKMAMCFQHAALFDSMSARENVAFPLREHTDLSEDEINRKVDDVLGLVGLANIGDRFPAELSGGMRKRVGIARAIVLEPEIILFDEPTTGLDPILGDKIIETMRRSRETFGYTSVIVTHDLKVTFSIADHVALLLNGRIAFDGTPEEFKNSKDPAVIQFLAGRSDEGPIQVL